MKGGGLFLLVLCLLALGAAPAGAQETPPGRIIVEGPGGVPSGAAGGPLTIKGAGFQPGDQIELHWIELGGALLGTAAGPAFQVAATVPSAPPGTYRVIAGGFDSEGAAIGQASADFTVTAPPGGGTGVRPPATPPEQQPTVFPPAPDTSFRGCSAPLANLIIGPSGGGSIVGTADGDRIFGSAGRDIVRGRRGNDCIDLRAGADRASGGSGGDLILGRGGRDRLSGGPGRDTLSGGPGRDRISARDGRRDRITCGSGFDRVAADRLDSVARSCERVRRTRRR